METLQETETLRQNSGLWRSGYRRLAPGLNMSSWLGPSYQQAVKYAVSCDQPAVNIPIETHQWAVLESILLTFSILEGGMATLSWHRTVLPLCIFGFLKEFRPSESFVTQYLLGPDKNFTKAQVNQEIYPVGTYSNLSLLVIVFLVTDWARYKPVIVIEGLAGVLVYALLIWGQNVAAMQAVEFFYGLFMATDIAYKTYMYAMSDVKEYQLVSACVQGAILIGRFLSGVVSQLSISLNLLSYHQLNFLTLGGVILSVPFAFLLPSVKGSLYFHNLHLKRQNHTDTDARNLNDVSGILRSIPNQTSVSDVNETEGFPLTNTTVVEEIVPGERKLEGLKAILGDFVSAYSKKNVLKWSLWWSLGTCGYLQVTSYIQMLWQVAAEDSNQELLNGAIDAAYTFLGTIVLWFVGRHKTNLEPFSSAIILVSCIAQGIFLLICSFFSLLWVQYTFYVIFKVLYHAVMVFASSEIAKSLSRDSHALIFGFNTFLALSLQTVLTIIVAGRGGLRLKIREQFLVYGGYFITLGVGFFLSICIPALRMFIQYIFSAKSNKPKQSVYFDNNLS